MTVSKNKPSPKRRKSPEALLNAAFGAIIDDALERGVLPRSSINICVNNAWRLYDDIISASDDYIVDPLTGKTGKTFAANPPSGGPVDYSLVRGLKKFLDCEIRATEVALPALLRTLRASQSKAAHLIADMIDPQKLGPWKLELRRHIPGKVPDRNMGEDIGIAQAYSAIMRRLRARGQKSPSKFAIAFLAEAHGVSDAAIKTILARVRQSFRES